MDQSPSNIHSLYHHCLPVSSAKKAASGKTLDNSLIKYFSLSISASVTNSYAILMPFKMCTKIRKQDFSCFSIIGSIESFQLNPSFFYSLLPYTNFVLLVAQYQEVHKFHLHTLFLFPIMHLQVYQVYHGYL